MRKVLCIFCSIESLFLKKRSAVQPVQPVRNQITTGTFREVGQPSTAVQIRPPSDKGSAKGRPQHNRHARRSAASQKGFQGFLYGNIRTWLRRNLYSPAIAQGRPRARCGNQKQRGAGKARANRQRDHKRSNNGAAAGLRLHAANRSRSLARESPVRQPGGIQMTRGGPAVSRHQTNQA
jgi:hypothetical protein